MISSRAARDGLGIDLADGLQDLAPYYDKAEALIGVLWQQRRPGEYT